MRHGENFIYGCVDSIAMSRKGGHDSQVFDGRGGDPVRVPLETLGEWQVRPIDILTPLS